MASRSSGNVSIIGYLDYRIFTVTVLDTNAKVTIHVSLVVPIELLWRSWCPSEVDSPMPNRGLILRTIPALHWWNLLYVVFQQTRRMTLLHQQPSITKKWVSSWWWNDVRTQVRFERTCVRFKLVSWVWTKPVIAEKTAFKFKSNMYICLNGRDIIMWYAPITLLYCDLKLISWWEH